MHARFNSIRPPDTIRRRSSAPTAVRSVDRKLLVSSGARIPNSGWSIAWRTMIATTSGPGSTSWLAMMQKGATPANQSERARFAAPLKPRLLEVWTTRTSG